MPSPAHLSPASRPTTPVVNHSQHNSGAIGNAFDASLAAQRVRINTPSPAPLPVTAPEPLVRPSLSLAGALPTPLNVSFQGEIAPPSKTPLWVLGGVGFGIVGMIATLASMPAWMPGNDDESKNKTNTSSKPVSSIN